MLSIIGNYKLNKAGARLRYLHKEYSSTHLTPDQFLDLVNSEYYSSFSAIYKNREVDIIKSKLYSLLNCTISNSFVPLVIDCASGNGFIYHALASGINFDQFYSCDPFQEFNTSDNKHSYLPYNFSESIKLIQSFGHKQKLVTLSSALHHSTQPYALLTGLMSAMNNGDYFLIVHEPMNTNLSTLSSIINFVITKSMHFLKPSKSRYEHQGLMKNVISNLYQKGITRRSITALAIRRLVDYNVGQKLDWMRLKIPSSDNEYFWSLQNTLNTLNDHNFMVLNQQLYSYYGTNKSNSTLNIFKNHLPTSYSIIARKLS